MEAVHRRCQALKHSIQEVQWIVAEIFAEPQRGEALEIANHLWRYLLHHSELQSREVCEIVDSIEKTV